MLLIIFFISLILYIYIILKNKVSIQSEPDIIISPGGYNGFYQLGLCHYIKNNFHYENKKIIGFSSGSWVGLFMSLNNKYSNKCIEDIFKQIDKCCPLQMLPSIFKNTIEKYDYTDFNIANLQIGLTDIHTKNMYIQPYFLSIGDCINCCIGSSFVPYVTYNDLFYFYNNKCVIDGGVYYKNYMANIDTNKVLVINYKVFRPNFNPKGRHFINFIKPKRTLYDLYLLGYNNARNNHDYLKKFFHSDS